MNCAQQSRLRTLGLWAAIAALGPGTMVASAPASASVTDLPPAQATALLQRFQPAMRFASQPNPITTNKRVELFRPTDPDDFVRMAQLERYKSATRGSIVGPADPNQIGALPAKPAGCGAEICWRLNVPGITASKGPRAEKDYFRLLEAARQGRPAAGRFVLIGRAVRGGSSARVHRRWIALSYIAFYPYNAWKQEIPGSSIWQTHEGDWEHAVVVLDAKGKPQYVGYSAHGRGTRRPWAEVEKVGTPATHPVQYVALGSHAGYHQDGRYLIDPPSDFRDFLPKKWEDILEDRTNAMPDTTPCLGSAFPLWGLPTDMETRPCSAPVDVRLPTPGSSFFFPGWWGGGGNYGKGGSSHGKVGSPPPVPLVPDRWVEWFNPMKDVEGMNWAPSPSFVVSPESPVAGERVTFSSTSSDLDTTDSVKYFGWDLDADGIYNEASERTARKRFKAAGTYRIGLKVRDGRYGTSFTTRTVVVRPAP